MTGLTLRGITKTFGELTVLSDISLELAEDELLVLLGPSGCGKSTLLRIIAGLEEAERGEIYIGSRRVERLRPRERDVALVFQNYSLYPHMTIAKNLAFPLSVNRIPKEEIKNRVDKVAELLGLTERLSDRPGQLSGGQRQRVALGRAIIREPSIFLLDEPLSNLDAELRTRMRQEIAQLQKKLGKPMIHVTHDQNEALTMADRIALLNEGRLEQVGSPEELYSSPRSVFVAGFVGSPKINLIDASVQDGRLIPFGVILDRKLVARINRAGDLQVGLRPEAIELSGNGEYSATVQSCEYLGDQYVAEIQFQELKLTISKLDGALKLGDTVRFSINREDLMYFDGVSGRSLLAMD